MTLANGYDDDDDDIRTTVVPIRILICTTVVPISKDSYPHDRHNQYIMLSL